MTRIKICGITNKKDAIEASRLGVDMLGFVFYGKSPRYVEAKTARDIIDEVPNGIKKVGVFVDEDGSRVSEIVSYCELDMVQFHGDEAPEYCAKFKDGLEVIKAFRIKDKKSLAEVNSYGVDYYMLDNYSKGAKGGTGEAFEWGIISDFKFLKPVILSGGLTFGNVTKAIRKVLPYAVDVSSGVEKNPGIKDLKLMTSFVETVRKT